MPAAPDDRAVLDEVRATTRRAARTFSLACRLLPRAIREDVYRLYLVFRTLDDLVDTGSPAAGNRVALLDFCRGMRDDLEGRPIATEEQLDSYCHHVAGTVGIVLAAVLGTTAPADRAAAALGKAMQRTNILRDIDEDVANGRIYLADATIRRFGSLAPGCREQLLRDQITRADALYDEGIAGIAKLRHGRRAIAAAAAMYREILRQIERDGYGRTPGRAVVPRSRRLLIAARRGVATYS